MLMAAAAKHCSKALQQHRTAKYCQARLCEAALGVEQKALLLQQAVERLQAAGVPRQAVHCSNKGAVRGGPVGSKERLPRQALHATMGAR